VAHTVVYPPPLSSNVNRRPKRHCKRKIGTPNKTINSALPMARPRSHHNEVRI
jgi:hypothetical protein